MVAEHMFYSFLTAECELLLQSNFSTVLHEKTILTYQNGFNYFIRLILLV